MLIRPHNRRNKDYEVVVEKHFRQLGWIIKGSATVLRVAVGFLN